MVPMCPNQHVFLLPVEVEVHRAPDASMIISTLVQQIDGMSSGAVRGISALSGRQEVH